jgi:hypothetical protein
MNNIKLFLLRNYTSIDKAAKSLNVNPKTVSNWCGGSPRNMLKHLPEISQTCGAPFAEIIEEVLICEREGVE